MKSIKDNIKIFVALVGFVASIISIYVYVMQTDGQKTIETIKQNGTGNIVGDGNSVLLEK